MHRETAYLRNPEAVVREESENASLLFNPDTGDVLVINATGRFIWDLCAERNTMNDIIREFKENFDCLPANLVEDIDSYMSIMTEGGFIGSQ
ncbi:MAG: PqqD family peptide modification chaperone [Candidatus Fermentibacteria bacterium]